MSTFNLGSVCVCVRAHTHVIFLISANFGEPIVATLAWMVSGHGPCSWGHGQARWSPAEGTALGQSRILCWFLSGFLSELSSCRDPWFPTTYGAQPRVCFHCFWPGATLSWLRVRLLKHFVVVRLDDESAALFNSVKSLNVASKQITWPFLSFTFLIYKMGIKLTRFCYRTVRIKEDIICYMLFICKVIFKASTTKSVFRTWKDFSSFKENLQILICETQHLEKELPKQFLSNNCRMGPWHHIYFRNVHQVYLGFA